MKTSGKAGQKGQLKLTRVISYVMNKYKRFVGCITLICCCFNEWAAELHLETNNSTRVI